MSETAPNNMRYYAILGVSKDASPDDLKRAWIRAAKSFHPDKGGDPDQFMDLCQAYDVLRDPQQRKIYDQRGEEALERSGESYAAIGFRRWRRLKLGKDAKHPLMVTHEELQNGATKLFRLQRNVICSKCRGKGSMSGASMSCVGCRGTGKRVSMRRVMRRGPRGRWRSWRISYHCSECRGTGEAIDDNDRCPQCEGDKVVRETKILPVYLEKGMVEGHNFFFPQEADEAPGIITGDVVLQLRLFDPKYVSADHKLSTSEQEDGEELLLSFSEGESEEEIRGVLSDSEEGSEEDPEEHLSLDYEEDVEEGSEESVSFYEEDSELDCEEDVLSDSEEDAQQDCEEYTLSNSNGDTYGDFVEISDIGFVLQQLFKEDE